MSPRYIGYTTLEIEERLSHHINEAKYEKCKSHKVNWISKILSLGYKPIIVEIERTYTLDDVLLLERNYIEEYSKSYRLTNSTNGGEVSKSFIDSVRDKISYSLREYYKYNNTWNKGLSYTFSKERNEKRRKRMGDKITGENNHFYGKSHSFETRKKLSDKNRIYKYNYDMIFKLYIVDNLTGVEISEKINIPDRVVRKAIRKYGLVNVKKEIYGKIKGYKSKVENIDFYKYYNKNLI